MKKLFCVILVVFSLFGCANDRSRQYILTPMIESHKVSEVPSEIQDVLWGLEEWHSHKSVVNHQKHRAYWTKYLNAGGIVMIASDRLSDAAFYKVREIIMEMTSKRPEIREVLTLHHDIVSRRQLKWFTNTKYYFTVLASDETLAEVPLHWNMMENGIGDPDGLLTHGACTKGMCIATTGRNMSVVVHEFAHMMHFAINDIERTCIARSEHSGLTFDERLRIAYESWMDTKLKGWVENPEEIPAKGVWNVNDNHRVAWMNWREFWAEGVRVWYSLEKGGFTSHEEFRAYHPQLSELISEWLSDERLPL